MRKSPYLGSCKTQNRQSFSRAIWKTAYNISHGNKMRGFTDEKTAPVDGSRLFVSILYAFQGLSHVIIEYIIARRCQRGNQTAVSVNCVASEQNGT